MQEKSRGGGGRGAGARSRGVEQIEVVIVHALPGCQAGHQRGVDILRAVGVLGVFADPGERVVWHQRRAVRQADGRCVGQIEARPVGLRKRRPTTHASRRRLNFDAQHGAQNPGCGDNGTRSAATSTLHPHIVGRPLSRAHAQQAWWHHAGRKGQGTARTWLGFSQYRLVNPTRLKLAVALFRLQMWPS